jgi:PAS domain S-box-containing protein
LNEQPPKSETPSPAVIDESVEELYEMAPCGYLTTTIDGCIVKVNRTLTDWLGYEPRVLTGGLRFVDILTAGGRIFYETHFNLLLRMQDSVDEIALDIVCKDGRIFPTLINARQKRDPNGVPVLNRFTIFNASDRRKYERDLLAARDLLHTTLSCIGDGVIATDAEGRVTFLNPVAEKLSGWTEDAASGKRIEEILHLVREDSGERIENPITHALRISDIVGLENHTILISKDGRRVTVDDSASPIRDASGSIVGGVLVFRDVSERRRAQQVLAETHEQLERSSAELRRSNEDLSQFANVASHDLRSPLNTVAIFSQLLERDFGDQLGEGKELLAQVRSATKRMVKLIDDLLLYARVSASGTTTTEMVDAEVQLQTAVENLHSASKAAGATITHDVLPKIPAQATSLVQIFQNLIGNAIHYRGTAPPLIYVSVADKETEWLFSCRDNGLGIEPQFVDQIFEPFKRLHGQELPGSGIGLAVCKRIVERYRGRIWVESPGVGQGSTFYFTLPKVSPAA